jgi:hypothetical protein
MRSPEPPVGPEDGIEALLALLGDHRLAFMMRHRHAVDRGSSDYDDSEEDDDRPPMRLMHMFQHRSMDDDEMDLPGDEPPPPEPPGDDELDRAIQASLAVPQAADPEDAAEDDIERALQESAREDAERAEIYRFLHDQRKFRSLLAAMPGVDRKHPCFKEFTE